MIRFASTPRNHLDGQSLSLFFFDAAISFPL
jgi:hypothetical protein